MSLPLPPHGPGPRGAGCPRNPVSFRLPSTVSSRLLRGGLGGMKTGPLGTRSLRGCHLKIRERPEARPLPRNLGSRPLTNPLSALTSFADTPVVQGAVAPPFPRPLTLPPDAPTPSSPPEFFGTEKQRRKISVSIGFNSPSLCRQKTSVA